MMKVLEQDIEKGIPDKKKYPFYGEGDYHPNIPAGDVFMTVEQ